MRRRPSWIDLTILAVALVACGSGEETATTMTFITTSTSTSTTVVPEPTTTTTALGSTSTTTLASTTTAGSSSGLPGDAIDFGPVEGDTLAVIGVAHDDVLNLRAAPGADQDILAGIPPLYSTLTAIGETRQLAASMWIAVDYAGLSGWVNLRFIAYLGATDDVTADVVDNLGQTPVAETMLELGLVVAESLVSEEPVDGLVMSAAPTVGDLGEVSFDVIGPGDDSVRGGRIHVFGQPVDEGFALDSVEVTPMCARGVDGDGHCI